METNNSLMYDLQWRLPAYCIFLYFFWLFRHFEGEEQKCYFAAFNFHVALIKVYHKLDWAGELVFFPQSLGLILPNRLWLPYCF